MEAIKKHFRLKSRLERGIGFDEDDVGDDETIETDCDPDLLIDYDEFSI